MSVDLRAVRALEEHLLNRELLDERLEHRVRRLRNALQDLLLRRRRLDPAEEIGHRELAALERGERRLVVAVLRRVPSRLSFIAAGALSLTWMLRGRLGLSEVRAVARPAPRPATYLRGEIVLVLRRTEDAE